MNTDTFPDYIESQLREKAAAGYFVFQDQLEVLPLTKCPICCDTGVVSFALARAVGTAKSIRIVRNDKTLFIDPNARLHFHCWACSSNAQLIATLLSKCGVDVSQQSFRIDYLAGRAGKERALKSALELLAESPAPSGLHVYHGDFGMGKSGILKALTVQFCLAGVNAFYTRAKDILGAIRSSYSRENFSSEDEIIRELLEYQFLAIDEIDQFNDSSDWAFTTLRTFLDKRYELRTIKATALATNLPPEKLWDYLASRLEDASKVLVGGDSLRGDNSVMNWLHN